MNSFLRHSNVEGLLEIHYDYSIHTDPLFYCPC